MIIIAYDLIMFKLNYSETYFSLTMKLQLWLFKSLKDLTIF